MLAPAIGLLCLAALVVAVPPALAGEIAEGLDPGDATTWRLPTADLYGVDAADGSAWAVGYWGTALYSEDGGKTWASAPSPVESTLFAVSFADAKRGWAVGEKGTILRSTDGGKSWSVQKAQIADPEAGGTRALDTHLFGVSAVGPNEAWAVGDLGVVLHTTDGGTTWRSVAIPVEAWADENFPERILNGVQFTDARHGWITGEFGTTLRTTDGGATWVGRRTLVDTVEDLYLFDIAAQPDGRAAVTGLAGAVLVTTDGGATWQPRAAPTHAGLFGVAWSGTNGIVLGDRGELYVTTDDGVTWQRGARPKLFNWLRGVSFADTTRAIAVGERGLILWSEDGGKHWEQRRGQSPSPRTGISVPEPGTSTAPGRKDPNGDATPAVSAPATPMAAVATPFFILRISYRSLAIDTTGMPVLLTSSTRIGRILSWHFVSSLRFAADRSLLLPIVPFVIRLGAILVVPARVSLFEPKLVDAVELEDPGGKEAPR